MHKIPLGHMTVKHTLHGFIENAQMGKLHAHDKWRQREFAFIESAYHAALHAMDCAEGSDQNNLNGLKGSVACLKSCTRNLEKLLKELEASNLDSLA